jgi:hypothetical protein
MFCKNRQKNKKFQSNSTRNNSKLSPFILQETTANYLPLAAGKYFLLATVV